jgi:hypothetical protein
MSGAQGAQPKGAFTATTNRSALAGSGGQQTPWTELRSGEDERGLPVRKLEDKVDDAAGEGGLVFGAGKLEGKPDLVVTGTSGG